MPLLFLPVREQVGVGSGSVAQSKVLLQLQALQLARAHTMAWPKACSVVQAISVRPDP